MKRVRALVVAAAISVATMIVSLSGVAHVVAQEQQPEQPGDRATTFRAVTGSQAESVPGGTLLIGAYGGMWLFMMLFVLRIGRGQAKQAAELERLSRQVAGESDA